MKRSISDMDSSDGDDVFDEAGAKSGSQMPNDSNCQLLNRKKRRGMIEKRRRDRINNSLLELRRLVPAAFEKQGSAKLEKAEILQMTVDHLKMLHSKGFDAFTFDPHKFAMDYHSIGFRECASEVARYLVAIEGMDLQDPLRLRLMSHLQCYSAQRDLALKSTSHSGWNPSVFTTPQYPPLPPSHSTNHSLVPTSESAMPLHGTAPVSSHYVNNNISGLSDISNGGLAPQMMSHSHSIPKSNGSPPPISSSMPFSYSTQSSSASSTMSQMNANHHHHPNPYFATGYATSTGVPGGVSGGGSTHPQGASVKHYRPWGAELAY